MTLEAPRTALLATMLSFALPTVGWSGCDPAGVDAADFGAARAAIVGACDCAAAASSGDYKRCAKEAARATLANRGCLRPVLRCAARSTCGRPGAVACCRTTAGGRVHGVIAASAERCRARRGGTACIGPAASVCDACDAAGCATICGDARLDPGEQCDGQPFCSPSCTLRGVGCCQAESTCRELPVFLASTLTMGCTPDAGLRGTCTASGSCAPVVVEADSLCCSATTGCTTDGFATVEEYATLAYLCLTSGGSPMVGGACGTDGACHPLPSAQGVWDLAGAPAPEGCSGVPTFLTVVSLDQAGTTLAGSGFSPPLALTGTVEPGGFTLQSTGVPLQVPCPGGLYEALYRLTGAPRPGGGFDVTQSWTLFPLVGGPACPLCTRTWTGTMTFAFDPFS